MAKTIELAYRGRILSKKNSKRIITNRRTGAPMMISNKAAKANENSMIDEFSKQTLDQTEPIGCCKIDILIYEPTLQRRDIDNQATSVLDALVEAEVIVDDSFKCVQELNVKFGGVDRQNPRAEIKITEQASRV